MEHKVCMKKSSQKVLWNLINKNTLEGILF